MCKTTEPEVAAQAPEFVAAPAIARRLSVTARYILLLADAGRIPCIRLGKRCVRFSPGAGAAALGISWEGKAL